ncbi:hypothetical protein VPH35_048273 [Triticum aestivum]
MRTTSRARHGLFPTTLFRCATVCKRWCRLVVTNPSFLRRCHACRSCPFAGFFTQQPCRDGVPTSFIPDFSDACIFVHAVPLISRHGVLLLRLQTSTSGVLMAVYDPLTGTFHELPWLDHYWDFEDNHGVSGYALLAAADCSSSKDDQDAQPQQQRPPFFKVLILTVQKGPMQYNLHTCSSTESGWNTCYGVMENEDGGISATLRQHNAIVCGGAAYWLLRGKSEIYTPAVSTETGHVSLTYDEPYLTADDGRLMVLSLQKDGRRLEIWSSYDKGRSFHALILRLKQPDQMMKKPNPVYTCLGEKSGMMLVKDNDRHVYIVHLETGVMQEVVDWPRSRGLSRRKTVPLRWIGPLSWFPALV